MHKYMKLFIFEAILRLILGVEFIQVAPGVFHQLGFIRCETFASGYQLSALTCVTLAGGRAPGGEVVGYVQHIQELNGVEMCRRCWPDVTGTAANKTTKPVWASASAVPGNVEMDYEIER